MRWIDFEYRDFHDVPRMIVIRLPDGAILLDSRFDDTADEYDDHYAIFRLAPDVDLSGSWERLAADAGPALGRIAVAAVSFDERRRKALDLDGLRHLLPDDLFSR